MKVSEAGDTVTPDQVLETATVTSAAGWAASCRPTLVLPTRVVMSHSWTVAVRAFLVSAREYTRLVVPLDACCVMAPDVAVRPAGSGVGAGVRQRARRWMDAGSWSVCGRSTKASLLPPLTLDDML